MPFLKNNKPRTTQPQGAVQYAPQWRGRALTGLLAGQTVATDGSAVTTVGTVTRSAYGGGIVPGGLASVHSASIQRAVIRGSTLGTSTTVGATLLVVFRTTTTVAGAYLAGLGSEAGSAGNTIFSLWTGSGSASALTAIVGGNNGNASINSVALSANDGRVHAALFTLQNFQAGGSNTRGDLYFDGQLVASTTSMDPGSLNLYSTIVSGGFRRGASDFLGADVQVLLCQPFIGALSNVESIALTRNPWQLFAPLERRIWVPSAGGGSPYTLALANGSYTHTGNNTALKASRKLSFNSGTYVTLGQAATLLVSRKLPLNAGSYSVTGNTPAFKVSRKLVFSSGSYSFTGYAATLTYTPAGGGSPYTLALAAGSYTFSGQTTTLKVARKLAFSTGSYTTTGRTVTLKAIRKLAFNSGSYVLNGKNVSLTYSGAPVSGMPPYITVYMWKRTA